MAKSRFEVECLNPQIVINSVSIDDTYPIKFTADNNKLIIEIEADTLKEVMKISYSVCNRVQLSIDTIKKFKKQ